MTQPAAVRRLWGNASALFIVQIANQLLPLITVPYLTRTLGIETYGMYAFGMALVMLAYVLTDFGFNLSTTPEIALNRSNPSYVEQLMSSVMGAKIALLIFACTLIVLYIQLSGKFRDQTSALTLLVVPIVGLTLQPAWIYNGLERMAVFSAFVLVTRLAYVALVFTTIQGAESLAWLITLNGLCHLAAAAMAFFYIRIIGLRFRLPSMSQINDVSRKALPFFWSRAAVATYTSGGAVFLGLLSTPTQVAYYAVADQVYKGAQALMAPISQVLYPHMARQKDFRLLWKVILSATFACVVGSLIGAVFATEIIALLFGPKYVGAKAALLVFLAVIVVDTPSVLAGYPLFSALDRIDKANLSVIFGGVLQLILLACFYVLQLRSAFEIAYSVLIAQLAVLFLRTRWASQLLRHRAL